MSEQKQETPPRIWLDGFEAEERIERGCERCIPYVPATELARVWEKAIAALPVAWVQLPMESPLSLAKRQGYNQAITDARRALERARDESEGQG